LQTSSPETNGVVSAITDVLSAKAIKNPFISLKKQYILDLLEPEGVTSLGKAKEEASMVNGTFVPGL
jgi:hypothetical protein